MTLIKLKEKLDFSKKIVLSNIKLNLIIIFFKISRKTKAMTQSHKLLTI